MEKSTKSLSEQDYQGTTQLLKVRETCGSYWTAIGLSEISKERQKNSKTSVFEDKKKQQKIQLQISNLVGSMIEGPEGVIEP